MEPLPSSVSPSRWSSRSLPPGRDAGFFLRRAQDDGGVRPGHAGQRPQLLDEEPVERAGILGANLQEIAVLPGDPVTLEHLLEAHHLPGEAVEVFRVLDAHSDEGSDVLAQLPWVHPRGVAGDDLLLLELADAIGHRGLRQAHLLRDLRLREPGVGLEQVDDLGVDVVHGNDILPLPDEYSIGRTAVCPISYWICSVPVRQGWPGPHPGQSWTHGRRRRTSPRRGGRRRATPGP